MKKSGVVKTREQVHSHFVNSFLEAQKVSTADKKQSPDKIVTPLLAKHRPRFHGSVPSKLFAASSSDFFCSDSSRRSSKDSVISETRTLFIKNIAEDSQPSDSEPLYESPMPKEETKASTMDKSARSLRRKHKQEAKDIRRTQSELEVNKPGYHKKTTPFRSFTRAFSPFMFRSRKKELDKSESSLFDVKKRITPSDSMSSIPVVMETGFPATSSTNLSTDFDTTLSPCLRGLVSPLVHPRNSLNLAGVPCGSLHLDNEYDQIETPSSRPSESRLSRPKPGTGNSPNFRRAQPPKYLNKQNSPSLDSVKDITPVSSRTLLSTPTTPTNMASTPTNMTSTPTNKTTPIILRKPLDKSTNKQAEPPLNVNFSGDVANVKENRPAVRGASPKPRRRSTCAECHSVLPAAPASSALNNGGSDVTLSPGNVTPNNSSMREEMQDILKRYSPSPKAGSYDHSSLHHKLREIKKELEEYKSFVQTNRKIGELREELEQEEEKSRRSSSTVPEYQDEVFYKTDKQMMDSPPTIPTDTGDYYKEIEVRINQEGIAVVRRRHRALPPESGRSEYSARRSTIHVDDRVFCDSAVLQSIYGHMPTHAARHTETKQHFDPEDIKTRSLKKGVRLRPFIHQKSVPNLNSEYNHHERYNACPETEKLKKEFHRSNSSNLPVPKKYIRAYTKFYEKKLALKLIDLNRFIQEEKETKGILIEKIRKSFHENDELLKSLNSTKRDILNMIEDIETPV